MKLLLIESTYGDAFDHGGVAIGVRVLGAASAWDTGVIADRARAAAHAYDPYVRVVDVAVAGVASR